MIEIERNNTYCTVKIEGGPLGVSFPFSFQCGDAYYAELLRQHFDKKLSDRIEQVRKEEYDKGYKDGRAKRGKISWFYSWLKLGAYR